MTATTPPARTGASPDAGAEPLTFHRHFWGAADGDSELVAGVDVLRRASAAGVRIAAQFAAFLADRAAAEAQYAAALRRIAQTAAAPPATADNSELLDGGLEEDAACLQGLYNPSSSSTSTSSSSSSSGASPNSSSSDASDGSDLARGRPLGAVRDATLAGTERVARALVAETAAAADAHERVAAALAGAAQDVRARAQAYRAQRAALLADAAAVSRERAALGAALRKAQARHAESVARKDRAAGKVAALEAQGGRHAHDLERRRQKLQKVSKEEMVSDALVKEAVDRVRLQHPMWVSRLTALMDGVQRLEEDRAATLQRAVLAFARAHDAARAPMRSAADAARTAAVALDAAHDLARWVAAAGTGAGPQLPPTFVPRASRTSLAESIVVAPATTKPLAIRSTVTRAASTTLPPLTASAAAASSSSSSSSSSQSPTAGGGGGGGTRGLLRHSTSFSKRGSLSAATTPMGAEGGAALLGPSSSSSSGSNNGGSSSGGGSSAGSTPAPELLAGETLRVRALYTFVGDDSDELDFQAGDEFLLLSATHEYNGWWIGQVRKRIGWFPSTYVRIVQRAGRSNSIVSRL